MTVGHLANDTILGGHDGTWETILRYSSEAAVDTYEGIAIITPRGRRNVELHLSFLRLHGQADDFKIQYSSIIRLFVLPKPNSPHTFVVVTLDPPIRKRRTLYPHIVIQFMTEEIFETDLNLSRDLLAEKYQDKLEESYRGPIHEVFTKVLCGLSGAKVTRPGSYRTCQDEYAVKTSLKAEHGLLYPLEKGFFFLPEPPMLILYEEVEFVGFGSYRREGASKSYRYLDLLVKRKNGQEHFFRNIQRNEYFNLFSFINGKHLKIMNLGDEQSDEDENFHLFMDGGGSSTDDSSGDESEASESGGEKEKSSEMEASRDGEGSKKRKWKKKRCHNFPKRSIGPFMNFSIAERARLKEENPDLPTAEIGRKLGQMWQNMSDEAKQPYIQAEIRETKRFKKKHATYRWHSMSWRGFRVR